MKIVLTTISQSIDSPIDPRFGRCSYFLVVDPNTLEWQSYANPGVSSSGGAGTLAAQFIKNQKAEAVISGDFGPNAFEALRAAGISMYLVGSSRTVREAIERFAAGQLEHVNASVGRGRQRR